MIHKFQSGDAYIVLDVESGAIHTVDRLVYDILDYYTEGALPPSALLKLKAAHPHEDIDEALAEITELERQGLLFTKEAEPPPQTSVSVVKALCLLVSQDCNLRCEYCFAGEGEYGAKGLMTLETAKAAVDFLIQASGNRRNLEIDFFGGEPLLNFDVVKETVAYARSKEAAAEKRFRFTITTNGLLLSDDKTDFINANMDNAVLSLDGRKEVNDRARKRVGGQGSYDTVVPAVQRFVEKRQAQKTGNSYYVRGTFTSHNLDFAADVLHLRDLGFDQISMEPVVGPDGLDYSITDSHLPRILAEYDVLAEAVAAAKGTPEAFIFFHFMANLENGPCAKKRISGCGAGTEYAAVAADGSLYPCHQFAGLPDKERFRMGHVQTGITDKRPGDSLEQANIHTQDGCGACFAKYFCGGGCKAAAYAANNDVGKPHALTCALQRKRTELAIALNIN